MSRYFFITLPLIMISIANAGNWSSSIAVEMYGDGNTLYESPYTVVNGYNNSALDGYGGETRSTETANITGSGNALVTGEFNSAFGNKNTISGGPWTQSAHVFGNGNSTNTAQSGTLGNNNNITGSNNATIGNSNTVTGNGIVIGNNSSSSNGGIAIGNGAVANNANQVNFGSDKQLTGVSTGIADTDVVNVGQLNQKANETLDNANNYTDNTLNDAKSVANDYTDQKIFEFLNDSSIDLSKDNAYALAKLGQLNNKLEKIRKQVNAGVASSIATASVPHKLFKRFSYGLGVGSYKNELAYSLGVKWGVSKNLALATAVSFNTQNDSSLSLSLAYGF